MCCMCGKCTKMMAWLVLILGILFLLRDLGIWNFWGISWWTIVFLLAGGSWLGTKACKECATCCVEPAKKKKK